MGSSASRTEMDQLGRAMDRGGGAPCDRPAGLSHRHPEYRPDPPRARSDGALQQGYDPKRTGLLHGLAYVRSRSWRRGTRIATRPGTRTTRSRSDHGPHRGRREPACGVLPGHHSAALEWPSAAVQAIVDEVIDFQIPGAGIAGFTRKAAIIARAGIYDLRGHRDDVLHADPPPWKIFELEGLNPAAEQARQRLQDHLDELDVLARKFEAR